FHVVMMVAKFDRERPFLGDAFEHPHVAHRYVRRIGFTVGGGKRLLVALDQRAGTRWIISAIDFLDEAVGPGADDRFHRRLEPGRWNFWGSTLPAADDEKSPHQRAFEIIRLHRRQTTLEHLDQVLSDRDLNRAVITAA